MLDLSSKRFYDSWLETIRLGLLSNLLPNPKVNFNAYWNIITSIVSPCNLSSRSTEQSLAFNDDILDLNNCKARVLASLSDDELRSLYFAGEICESDYGKALQIAESDAIPLDLNYSQDYLMS